jgi:transcriptional antiterminator RfaH
MEQEKVHWYAVHTKPRKEFHVRCYLESRGIEAYLPALQRPSRRCPRETCVEPFLARYLFVHLDPQSVPLSSVNWSPGVHRLVSFGGEPAIVPDAVIGWLRRRLAQAEAEQAHKGLPLRHNDRLRLTAGPLRGLEAVFDCRLSAEDRARVFVDILGRLTACEVPLGWLERV